MAQHVTVFSTAACPKCSVVKKWMKTRGIEYSEVRVDHDSAAAAELKAKGYKEAPVLRVIRPNGAEVWWSGFRPSMLESLETTAGR